MYYQGVMYTGFQKPQHHWADVSWSIKIKVKGVNIVIVYTMVAYGFNFMHDEDDVLNLSPMRWNTNDHPRE